jgi:response regulator RpfG family c-di-GMP phosphodiesterase
MPKLDGMGLLRELRSRGFRRPFIFATGVARHESTIEAMRMGAFDFLEKPFDLAQVTATLRQALANSRTVSRELTLDGLVGRDALATFAEDGAAQLTFASSALQGLAQEDRYREDTSFLLRISVALETASRGLGQETIEKVAMAAVDLFTELRIDGRMASEAQLMRAGALIGWLRDAIDGVGSTCRLETLAERLLAPAEVKRKRAS